MLCERRTRRSAIRWCERKEEERKGQGENSYAKEAAEDGDNGGERDMNEGRTGAYAPADLCARADATLVRRRYGTRTDTARMTGTTEGGRAQTAGAGTGGLWARTGTRRGRRRRGSRVNVVVEKKAGSRRKVPEANDRRAHARIDADLSTKAGLGLDKRRGRNLAFSIFPFPPFLKFDDSLPLRRERKSSG